MKYVVAIGLMTLCGCESATMRADDGAEEARIQYLANGFCHGQKYILTRNIAWLFITCEDGTERHIPR